MYFVQFYWNYMYLYSLLLFSIKIFMFFEYLCNLQNPCKVYTKDLQGYISAKNKFQGIVGRY